MNSSMSLLGRLLYGGYFIYNGINHFKSQEMLSQYAGSKGVPSPEAAVLGSGGLLVVGGLSVLSGVKPRLGLEMLALFLLGVTPVMHAFWTDSDPHEKMSNQVNFLKNTALLGSVLMLIGSLRSPEERSERARSGHRTLPAATA